MFIHPLYHAPITFSLYSSYVEKQTHFSWLVCGWYWECFGWTTFASTHNLLKQPWTVDCIEIWFDFCHVTSWAYSIISVTRIWSVSCIKFISLKHYSCGMLSFYCDYSIAPYYSVTVMFKKVPSFWSVIWNLNTSKTVLVYNESMNFFVA